MLHLPQSITPAVQDFLNAQYALFNDMSEHAFESVQKINELNIQTAQSVLEDSLKSAQQVMTAQSPYEAASIAAAQAQPAAEKLRNYHQELSNITVNAQAAMARAAEAQMPHVSRSAAAGVDEAARTAQEQTEQVVGRTRAATEKAATGATATASAPTKPPSR